MELRQDKRRKDDLMGTNLNWEQEEREEEKQEREKEAAKQRLLLEQEKITTDMIQYGLWQSENDVNEGLKAG